MSETDEQRAAKLYADAEKKARGGGGGGGFFSGLLGGRSEEANELYVKAANVYKIGKKWNDAGNCFVKAAENVLSRGEAKHEAASNYVDASNCYRKTDARKAVDCLQRAADIYTDMGRFTMAAKHHTSMAEIYESELPDVERAMEHYEKAGDYYKGEESKSSANKCMLQVAKYAAQLEQYQKAIGIYEEVGAANADNNLLKYSAKEYFFRALLCHLCVDLINAQHALARYEDAHPAFGDSRECKFVKDLLLAVEEQNPELFTETVQAYDKISRLDDWYTALLVRVKRQCGEGDDDLK